jgi:TPR repeat protein
MGQAPSAPPGAPPVRPELQEAMTKADGGDPKPLTAMADAGAADAQYYAGVMYIFGRGQIPRDPAKGCAYEQKASASRADAMHMVGACYQNGGFGAPDKAQAEAAYTRASAMGFPKSKCALGQMLMTDPAQADRGVSLCKEAAKAGDVDAQKAVAAAYVGGTAVKPDHGEARKWYDMAAKQNDLDSMRTLGSMYVSGDGGKKDTKKALELWMAGEKAGDPMAPILVADQLFSQITGGKTPAPGQYKFKGGVPVQDIGVVEDWYKEAAKVDPRPEVRSKADYALKILASLKSAANVKVTKSN